jgi:Tfp pilus assembly protein PilE
MNTLFTIVVFVFVLAVLAVVAYAAFEVSPFAHHAEQFRDPRTGRRRWQSPHLD